MTVEKQNPAITRRRRCSDILNAVLDSHGGSARPHQVEAVLYAAGFGPAEVRAAFDRLHLVAVADPRGRVLWSRRRSS